MSAITQMKRRAYAQFIRSTQINTPQCGAPSDENPGQATAIVATGGMTTLVLASILVVMLTGISIPS